MNLRKRILWLISIMITVTLIVGILAVSIFYKAAFYEERKRLSELAKSQSRLIESIARFNKKYDSQYPGGAKKATISQLIDSHNRYERFSDTGELLIAEKQGNTINFIFGHKQDEITTPDSVSPISGLAEPMSIATSGGSGTVIGFDYESNKVLAAYEHISALDLGLVAKINISEIRAPFLKAIVIIVGVGILAVATGLLLFIRITNPMIKEMTDTIVDLEDALCRVKLLSGFLPICASCKKIRDDEGYWNQIESYIQNHSEAEFSHSICPDCAKKLYPDMNPYEQ